MHHLKMPYDMARVDMRLYSGNSVAPTTHLY